MQSLKTEIAKKVAKFIIEQAKGKGIYVAGLYVNGKIPSDVSILLCEIYYEHRDQTEDWVWSVICKAKSEINIKTFKLLPKDSYNEKRKIGKMRLEADKKLYEKLLIEYASKEVAFGIGIPSFGDEFIKNFLYSNKQCVQILEAVDKKRSEAILK